MTIPDYISAFLLSFALLRLLVALVNYFSRPFLPKAKPSSYPLVSVLIPARNEEKNMGKLLSQLTNQTYTNLGIFVYDDLSTDNTATIVKQHQAEDNRIGLIEGKTLPSGWLGKNHACHHLSQKATGRYLLFLDADVTVSPDFVENAVAYMQKYQLSLLTLFPRQQTETLGEQIVVPNMKLILLTLLPLWLVAWSRRPSLSAANGQMMMFRANDYKMYNWHMAHKHATAEDIVISRQVKRHRLRMATLLGRKDIECRMYDNYSSSIQGFSKNVASYFGGSIPAMIFYAFVLTISPFWLFFMSTYRFFGLYLLSVIVLRIVIASISEQKIVKSVLLSPLQHVAFLHIVWKALGWKTGKSLRWKGREI